MDFKQTCERLGMSVHEKAGKLIWPTQQIDWLGWVIDSVGMMVIMSISKATKGDRIVTELIEEFEGGAPTHAKEAMSVWGFLNFIANVIKQAQPYSRELGRCIVEAQVFQAWAAGRKRFNPVIKVTPLAIDDLKCQ